MKLKAIDPRSGRVVTPRRMEGKVKRGKVFASKYMREAR